MFADSGLFRLMARDRLQLNRLFGAAITGPVSGGSDGARTRNIQIDSLGL
jgi:hypothetical protein